MGPSDAVVAWDCPRDVRSEECLEGSARACRRRTRFAPCAAGREGERASPREIEHAWETAVQWRDTDSDAARAAARIRAEVEERYGIDPDHHPTTKSQADSMSDQATAEERSGAPDVVPAGEAERDLEDGRDLVAVSHAQSVAAAASGPSTPPRVRRARGQGTPSVQRERGR